MLHQVFKVSMSTLFVEDAVKSVTFLDFRLSQGNVAIHVAGQRSKVRCGGNHCSYAQTIFLRINWRKNFESRSTFAKVIAKHQVAYFF